MSGVGPKRVRSNFRVEIAVPSWTSRNWQPSTEIPVADQERHMNELLRQVRRHVDGGDNARPGWDTAVLCDGCGSPWEGFTPADDPDSPNTAWCCGAGPSTPLEGTQA